jgi:hypothetical protein
MRDRPTLSPELRAAIERAREQLRESGDLLDPPTGPIRSPFPPEVRAILREWVESGDFQRAIDEVTADDPDLQTL